MSNAWQMFGGGGLGEGGNAYKALLFLPFHPSLNPQISAVRKTSMWSRNVRSKHSVLPKPTCQMLYNTLVLPLFDYCSPVWDSCGVGSKAYLDKLNRRAACIIEGRSIGAEELKSTLGWPSLQARRNYLKCVLVHKCLHGIAPSYLLSEFRHAHLFHGYNTRSRDLLRPPFAKTTKYQGSFRINGARTYNTLPRTIRQVDTLSEFKIKLKRHFKQ